MRPWPNVSRPWTASGRWCWITRANPAELGFRSPNLTQGRIKYSRPPAASTVPIVRDDLYGDAYSSSKGRKVKGCVKELSLGDTSVGNRSTLHLSLSDFLLILHQLIRGFYVLSSTEKIKRIGVHNAKEGPVEIQYKSLVPIYVFPEMKLFFPKQNYNVLSLSSFTHISARIHIFPGLVCLFCCREICGPILGIYKSLTLT